MEDIAPLLPPHSDFPESKAIEAFNRVWNELIVRLPGEPWKKSESIIGNLRETTMPNLLR